MKHAMLAMLVLSLVLTGGLDQSFFMEDSKPICLIVVGDDADFTDLLTAAQIAKEIVDLAGNGCPFSLIRFAEEISKKDIKDYNLILLGETGLEVEGKSVEVADGLYLLEDFFGTKRDVLVVEDAQSLIDVLQNL
jgi:hypothetical protein